ncbi:hypothetical protein, partial [Vibrio alginolyticus]|uniref:hypothetical protein n=1 Tax=Vibrio alginolyticus TaxID=663 RepID=UPI0022B2D362
NKHENRSKKSDLFTFSPLKKGTEAPLSSKVLAGHVSGNATQKHKDDELDIVENGQHKLKPCSQHA